MGILTHRERSFVAAIAPRFVPEAQVLTPDDGRQMLDLIDDALAERPPALRRQFSVLLAVLRWAPAARFGRPLDRLPAHLQDRVLHWFQDVSFQKLRAGFWGLRTLVFLGYYGRPGVGDRLGYRPVLDGNALLHDRTPR